MMLSFVATTRIRREQLSRSALTKVDDVLTVDPSPYAGQAGCLARQKNVSRIRGVSSLQKIRLSSDGANPLNGSRNWRADGDGCVEFAPDAGVAHGLRV